MPKKRNVALEVQEARRKRDEAMKAITGDKPKKKPSQKKLNKMIRNLFIKGK